MILCTDWKVLDKCITSSLKLCFAWCLHVVCMRLKQIVQNILVRVIIVVQLVTCVVALVMCKKTVVQCATRYEHLLNFLCLWKTDWILKHLKLFFQNAESAFHIFPKTLNMLAPPFFDCCWLVLFVQWHQTRPHWVPTIANEVRSLMFLCVTNVIGYQLERLFRQSWSWGS